MTMLRRSTGRMCSHRVAMFTVITGPCKIGTVTTYYSFNPSYSYLTLPYLTLPYLTLPYLTLPYLTRTLTSPSTRPCPLCRKKGAFVPIAFAFEPAICYSARPTHVFNPCGHVASRMVCEKWSKIPMHSSNAVTQVLKPFCPFCAT